jgi:hypothetical protein
MQSGLFNTLSNSINPDKFNSKNIRYGAHSRHAQNRTYHEVTLNHVPKEPMFQGTELVRRDSHNRKAARVVRDEIKVVTQSKQGVLLLKSSAKSIDRHH